MDSLSTLVLIPTYNERENLPLVVRAVLAIPNTTVLVLDDNSPDGTGAVADGLAANDSRVAVLHRAGPRGLGRAYLDGLRMALRSDSQFVCQMDADLSHDATFLPALIRCARDGAGLVVGSRYVPGGAVRNWPARRVALSVFANAYVRTLTGLQVHDCTSGYRCWRRDALAKIPLDGVASTGYSFLVELLFLAAAAGLVIAETPIVFTERRIGTSKVSSRILVESLATPWRLALADRFRRAHLRRQSEAPDPSQTSSSARRA